MRSGKKMMNGSMRRGETRGEDEMRELEEGQLKRKLAQEFRGQERRERKLKEVGIREGKRVMKWRGVRFF